MKHPVHNFLSGPMNFNGFSLLPIHLDRERNWVKWASDHFERLVTSLVPCHGSGQMMQLGACSWPSPVTTPHPAYCLISWHHNCDKFYRESREYSDQDTRNLTAPRFFFTSLNIIPSLYTLQLWPRVPWYITDNYIMCEGDHTAITGVWSVIISHWQCVIRPQDINMMIARKADVKILMQVSPLDPRW